MEKLKNTRILGLIGIICSLLGIFLPYVTITFFATISVKLWGYLEGKIMLLLTLANFLFIFKDYAKKYIPKVFDTSFGAAIEKANPKLSLIPTGLVVLLAIYLSNGDIGFGNDYVKYGLGFWTLWGGAICLVAHAILYKGTVSVENTVEPINSNTTIINNDQTIVQQPEMPQVQPQNVDNNVKYCSACGNKCNAADTKCTMCGKDF